MREPTRLHCSGSRLGRELLTGARAETTPDHVRQRILTAAAVGASAATLTLVAGESSASAATAAGAAASGHLGAGVATGSLGMGAASGQIGVGVASGSLAAGATGGALGAGGAVALSGGLFSAAAAKVAVAAMVVGAGAFAVGSQANSGVIEAVQVQTGTSEPSGAELGGASKTGGFTASDEAGEAAALRPEQTSELEEVDSSEQAAGLGKELGASQGETERVSSRGAAIPSRSAVRSAPAREVRASRGSAKRRSAAAPRLGGSGAPDMEAELQMLSVARELMKSGKAQKVIEHVASYRRHYPHGLFRPEMNMLSTKAHRAQMAAEAQARQTSAGRPQQRR